MTNDICLTDDIYTININGSPADLRKTAAALRDALKKITRERAPLDWASIQNHLGLTLALLSEHKPGPELTEAATAYREALKEFSQEDDPMLWAQTKLNLGVALVSLSDQESGTELLYEALTAFHGALQEVTREEMPEEWSDIQQHIGEALGMWSDRKDKSAFDAAVAFFRSALKERSRARNPLKWAQTQHSLGMALLCVGERDNDIMQLIQACKHFHEAINSFGEINEKESQDITKEELHKAQVLMDAYARRHARVMGLNRTPQAVAPERPRPLLN